MLNTTHIAGIVPCAGQALDFNMPWHDVLQPIAQNFLAVERAVLECATAGCETIWVICEVKMQPLIRYRLGDYVEDPAWNRNKKFVKFPSLLKKQIPIYYIPINAKDIETKNSIPWSIIYGSLCAQNICAKVSTYLKPKTYYVSFPFGVYPSHIVRKYRNEIAKGGNVILEYNGKSFKDNEYLAFSFGNDDLVKFKQIFREKSSKIFDTSQPKEEWIDGRYPTKKLPLHLRYSGRFLTIKDVFEKFNNYSNIITVDWYNKIDNWIDYSKYISENLSRERPMKRPKGKYLAFREWNSISEI